MSSTIRLDRMLGSIGAAGLALALLACGGAKPMQAQAPSAAVAEKTMGSTNMQAPLPNTPTAAHVAISDEVLRACNIPDGNAYFAFDSARLTAFDSSPLDAVATCFTHGPMAGKKLSLVGHADPRGSAEYNMTLGQSRADAVGRYLTDHGLAGARVTTTSRGAMDATGRDETGWAHDRRVDVQRGR